MVNYRRLKLINSYYFFTVTLRDRDSDFLVKHITELKESIRRVKNEFPFKIEAIVILPEHLHTIWLLPEKDVDYSERWRRIKGSFTRLLHKKGYHFKKANDGTYNLWQRRYWEHVIRDEKDLNQHIDYIHYNPVKHGLVQSVQEWPYSSYHQYVKTGKLPINWGRSFVEG